MVGFLRRGRGGLRLRQLDPRRGAARRGTRAPSRSPASSPPTSARSSARARDRSAGWRCRATRKDIARRPTRRCSTCSPRTTRCAAGSPRRRSASPSRDCRRGSAGSATASATSAGVAFNDLVADGRGRRPDRHRPRPPRLRLGRLAVPRDRVDARRLGRHRRLAAAQRAASTRRRARRGSRSTTAAASASGARCTPGRSCVADGTALAAREDPPRAHERPGHRASSATSTRATSSPRRWPRREGVRVPMREGP